MKRTRRDPLVAIFDGHCCWPDCPRAPRDVAAPLCGEHLIRAWHIVQDARQLLEPPPPPQPTRSGPRSTGVGVVYFIRFGTRIKIGWTQNLPKRLRVLPHDEVLHTQPGTFADEQRCHAAFAHLRDTGEWFRAEPDLLAFIDDLRRAAG